MRIMIALVSVLAMQVSLPAPVGGQEPPEALVRRALEKDARDTRAVHDLNCTRTTIKKDLDAYGQPKPSIENKNKKVALPKFDITVQKLLRPGRYKFKQIGTVSMKDGDIDGTIELVSFMPAGAHQPGPQPDPKTRKISKEERALNWIINRVVGIISLDQQTGVIRKIEAWLPKEASFFKIGYVYLVRFEYNPEFVAGVWVPKRINVRARYNLNKHSFPFLGDATEHFEEYTTLFACKNLPPS